MKKETFNDLLFQILNENNSFLKHVELDHTNDTFLICCTDDSCFSLQIREPVSCFMVNDYNSKYIYTETSTYTQEKTAYLHELDILAQENPFVFLIFIVILKLSELNILSSPEAEELMGKIQSHAEALKEQWDKNIRY